MAIMVYNVCQIGNLKQPRDKGITMTTFYPQTQQELNTIMPATVRSRLGYIILGILENEVKQGRNNEKYLINLGTMLIKKWYGFSYNNPHNKEIYDDVLAEMVKDLR